METGERARGALYGLALGDALGMPTQMLSRAQIPNAGANSLPGFEPAPPGHPIAAGLPAGSVTDDTEQAILLGRLLVAGHGTVDPQELATALVNWEHDMAERGSLDLLGPSTKRAVAAVLAGTPAEEAGAAGNTNGAAMRIAPVGIAGRPAGSTRSARPGRSVGAGRLCGDGQQRHAQHRYCARRRRGRGRRGERGRLRRRDRRGHGARRPGRARLAAGRGHWVAGADVAARVEWATSLVAGRDEAEAADLIYTLVGTSLATQESVPAVFAVLAAVPDDPWQACLLAASLGGDCDTIAAMAGAVAGACHGVGAFPADAVAVIDTQGLGLAALADDLYALRTSQPR